MLPNQKYQNGLRWCKGSPQRLILVGNGFDIAHGLGTSYSSFAEYLAREDPSLYLLICQSMYEGHVDCWWDFEERLGHGKTYNMVFDIATVIHDAILDAHDEEHAWMYTLLQNLVFDLGAGINESLSNHFSKWAKETYRSGKRNLKPLPHVDFDNAWSINFNYTYTIEDVYKAQNVFHIHGAAGSNHLVFGHSGKNEYVYEAHIDKEYYENGIENPFVNWGIDALADFWRQLEKPSKDIIDANTNYFKALKDVIVIESLGFSFSEVDSDYIKAIVAATANSNPEWHIGYYNNPQEIAERAISYGVPRERLWLFRFNENSKGPLQAATELNGTEDATKSPETEVTEGTPGCAVLVDIAPLISFLKKGQRKQPKTKELAKMIVAYATDCLANLLKAGERISGQADFVSLICFYDSRAVDTSSSNRECVIRPLRRLQHTWVEASVDNLCMELLDFEQVTIRPTLVSAEDAIKSTVWDLNPANSAKMQDDVLGLSSKFDITYAQCGADLRIGLDILSLGYSGGFKTIILISDRVNCKSAIQAAQEQGVFVVLDPLDCPYEKHPLCGYVNAVTQHGIH